MASNPLLTRKKAVIAVIEDEYGKPAPIENGVLMLVTALEPTPYQGNTVERTRMRDTLGGYAQINTGPNTSLQITVPWSGSGMAGTPPALGVLLRACNMAEEIISADADAGIEAGVEYLPVSGNSESVTLYFFEDGEQQVIPGARGTLTGTGNVEELPTLQFTFTGLYQRPVEKSRPALTVQNQADEIPVNFQNTTTFSLQGYEAIGQNFSFDLGNTVTYQNRVNYEAVNITDRAVTGQLSIQAPRLGEKDVYAMAESHQEIVTGPILFEHGTTAGNIVGLRTVKSQLAAPSKQDVGSIVYYQMDARHLPDAGDDELVLYFR